jgi:hypothetical protein
MDNITITLSKEDAAMLKYLLENNTVANTMEKCYLLIPLIKVLEAELDGFRYQDTWK